MKVFGFLKQNKKIIHVELKSAAGSCVLFSLISCELSYHFQLDKDGKVFVM